VIILICHISFTTFICISVDISTRDL